MKPIVEVNNLSKKYQLGTTQPYFTLRDTIANLTKKKPKNKKSEFWALKDVSFTAIPGDTVGIIGRNGAGKSTILKILSRITPPTLGSATLRGRIGSLLEVGTGFHQELTGRENIYLNGAILGMSRYEINAKFDSIVEFSGIEKFLDTPVKHYSSGMYMRLAFAVAAHLESEILVVDEVLAVGDTEFQKKCLNKMGEITKNEGRTILFVSHNMSAIKKLCNKCVLLDRGKKILEGNTENVITEYTKKIDSTKLFTPIKIPEIGLVVSKISIKSKLKGKVIPGQPLRIELEIDSTRNISGLGFQIMISHDDTEGRVFLSNTKATKGLDYHIKKGKNRLICLIDSFDLCSGQYRLGLGIDMPLLKSYYFDNDLYYFDVTETTFENSLLPTLPVYGHVYLKHTWITEYA